MRTHSRKYSVDKARQATQTAITKFAPPSGRVRIGFYGLTSPSNAVCFLIEGSARLRVPADWDVEATRPMRYWLRPRDYRIYTPSGACHQFVITKQLKQSLESLPERIHFNVVMLGRTNKLDDEMLIERGLAPSTRGRVAAAVKLVDGFSKHEGAPDLAGLRFAMKLQERMLAVKKRRGSVLDTVFLVSDAGASGIYAHPQYALEAFDRHNRFARLVVHTVRISGGSAYREAWHRGLAERSGGSYIWARKPPGK